MITRERLIEEFTLLDKKATLLASREVIPEELVLYLIGGGNLALRGIKAATADVDVVVEDLHVLRALEEVLINPSPELRIEGRYIVYVKEVEHEYKAKLGAFSVYKKLDPQMGDFNFDVFVRRVLRGITLSEGMKTRAMIPEEFTDFKTIRIYLVSLEDIFLFKGVTSLGRSKDIDDLLRLIEHGVNFDIILAELEVQKALLEKERFEWLMGILYEKALRLREILQKEGLRSKGLNKFIKNLGTYFVRNQQLPEVGDEEYL
ncbi:hypothetical protein E3E31_12255 [Thermococcus sp. M39]|uniref:hypothetical protein n=1 Tax=unclassified Thermococcus TaxID=2627626 RepID=UPI00143AEB37|nr:MULTISPECIES: hypothetical protein [unclassified Thermococcus]NJE09280.1 hypothetical protein [Thermococcus sp. M39]NJE13863.1 hypothetical protein [Thermococcus sp. LS2]